MATDELVCSIADAALTGAWTLGGLPENLFTEAQVEGVANMVGTCWHIILSRV